VIDLSDAMAALVRERLARRRQPHWVDPALPTPARDRFSGPDWIFEPKFDGERCLAFRDGDGVRLMTRRRVQVNDAYPALVDALAAQNADDFVVDGQVVESADGADRAGGEPVCFYVFDVLHSDGCDTTGLTLRERKTLLRRLLSFDDPLRYTDHRDAEGEKYWQQACERGWKGMIAKRADAPYQQGRTPDWLQFTRGSGPGAGREGHRIYRSGQV
jgi:ATP-dependent DNA ligase